MKIAFLTFYEIDNDVYRIYNGFSFVDHLFENHKHFFINTTKDNEELINNECIRLKKELKNFDKIYVTIIFIKHLKFIYNILDERFILGGPGIKLLKTEKLIKNTKVAIINDKLSFESYLNVPIQEKFTQYWIDHLGKDNKYFYSMTSSTICPFSCKFCTYSPIEKFTRKIDNIFNVNNDDIIYFSDPTFGTKGLNYFKNNIKYIEEKNLSIVLFTRSDLIIQNKLKEFKNLSNFNFFIGLEYLSNDCLKRMNKTSTVENFLKIAEIILQRNGHITIGFLLFSPIFTKDNLKESINNFIKLKALYNKYNRKNINCAIQNKIYFINNINVAESLSNNIETIKMYDFMDDNEIFILKHQTIEDYKNNEIFSNMFLDNVNYFNKNWTFI